MNTTIEKTKTTTIVLPATELEKRLEKMIGLVEEGMWTKGSTFHPDRYHRCTLGMILLVCQEK